MSLHAAGDEGANEEQVVWTQLREDGHPRVHHEEERKRKVSGTKTLADGVKLVAGR